MVLGLGGEDAVMMRRGECCCDEGGEDAGVMKWRGCCCDE
jgi:hypothetical protein